ncbi:MAG: dUTP diphosphatase [Patescibacteria group bacterium]|nr:dUTP diphosphatase [Patescibacteria group bacterium]
MQVKIKRIDKALPLPVYKTEGAVAFDLILREDATIQPGEIKKMPCNVVVDIPEGYMLMLAPRSSMPYKKPGLIQANSIGIIDQDYCGPEDELKFSAYNTGKESIKLLRGETLTQAIFVKIEKFELVEVDEMSSPNRGGFGSTDNK